MIIMNTTNETAGGAAGTGIPVNEMRAQNISLRDWFAGQALMAVFDYDVSKIELEKQIAESAYRMSDAMLKAREQRE